MTSIIGYVEDGLIFVVVKCKCMISSMMEHDLNYSEISNFKTGETINPALTELGTAQP